MTNPAITQALLSTLIFILFLVTLGSLEVLL
jgi:hypothetical protein